MAKFGLAWDNPRAVELVLGDVLRVTQVRTRPVLGASWRGRDLGVATSFTYRLHPVETSSAV